MYIRIFKTRDVISPSRGHPTDAGIDFYVPRDFSERKIKPGESVLIPSGIKIEIPIGYMGLFLNKSSVASKKRLLIGAQVIDPYYSGEVHIDLHNVGEEEITIKPDDKVAQLVLVPISHCQILETVENDLYYDFKIDKYREEGGFGSTNL